MTPLFETRKRDPSEAAGKECESAPQSAAIGEIRFDYRAKLFFAALAFYLLLATCFRINGSSVGAWDIAFGRNADQHLLFGSSRNLRADEWVFHTPAILSQCNSTPPFPVENYSLGGYKAPLIMNVPVRHFSMILRPQFWLFFFTDVERAFAFYWSMKLVFLMAGIFLLLMMLLENHVLLALFGALWVYFSGYTQWFFSSPQEWPELVGCFALFTTTFVQILVSKRRIRMVLFSLLFLIAFFNFAVSFYPAHQVPLAYLSLCILLGVLLPRAGMLLSELRSNRFRMLCILLALASAAGLLFLFYGDIRETFHAMADTVYPGQRRSPGGGISIANIFNGFFGPFMSEHHFPAVWPNACESSNFYLFFPVPMMLAAWECLRRRKVPVLHSGLALYTGLLLLWMVWGFPKPLAQLALFDRILEQRALLGLGISSIVWTCLLLHGIEKGNASYGLKRKMGITALMLIGASVLSYHFNSVTHGFASVPQILMVCAFVTGASYALLSRMPVLFAALILIPNILAYGMINPIRTGLGPILDNPLYNKASQVIHEDPDAKWAIYGDGSELGANFISAAGAKVFNGLKYLPHLDELKELSIDPEDMKIYNRSGTISLVAAEGAHIGFRLNGNGAYTISVDPADACWDRLHITHILSMTKDGTLRFIRYPSRP